MNPGRSRKNQPRASLAGGAEALRDDERFSYVGAWEYAGTGQPPVLHKEPLEFEEVHPTQRSYK